MYINNEHWKPTHIFSDNYYVSDFGKVYSVRTGKTLKHGVDRYGYPTCVLCVEGERYTFKIHKLVALAFIPNPENKPCIDHINGIKDDNRAENLRWCDCKENSNNPITLVKLRKNAMDNMPKMYAASVKRNFGRKAVEVYKDGNLIGVFATQRQAAIFTGATEGDVSGCVSGYHKTSHGYTFKRVDVKICS